MDNESPQPVVVTGGRNTAVGRGMEVVKGTWASTAWFEEAGW